MKDRIGRGQKAREREREMIKRGVGRSGPVRQEVPTPTRGVIREVHVLQTGNPGCVTPT
jgi:hypothetical protein